MSETKDRTLVEARGVTKVFKDFWGRPRVTAVRDVDLTVKAGRVFGLLGPNGAGKSTLIKMLLGHLYPTRGVLKVLDRDPRDVQAKKRLGYLPERAVFYRNLTAREILALFGNILNIPEADIRRRTDQLLEMVGLQGARDRRVGGFSHGMGRRLGLAQALLNDPDLLLLDEPTAGLDPIGCHEVKKLIGTLAGRGKTVIMSSHLLADVQDVCDEIMIMYGGRVQQIGTVRELLAQKGEIQVRAPTVSPETLQKLRDVLGLELPADRIEVSTPTRSLEEYFLDVVREANERRLETAGAEMGGGVADYLVTGPAATDVLKQLTRAETDSRIAPSRQPPDADMSRDRETVDRATLKELSDTERHGTPDGDSPEPSDPAVDQDLLDRLTRS